MKELNIALFDNNLQRIQQLLATLSLSQEDLYWVVWGCININGPVWTLDTNCFKAILQYVDVNYKSETGQPHLIHAASHNNLELVRVLLEHGAHPILDESDRTVFQNKGYMEVIDLIDNYGFEIKEPDSDS